MKRLLAIRTGFVMLICIMAIGFPITNLAEKPEPLSILDGIKEERAGIVSVKKTTNGEMTEATYGSGNNLIKLSANKMKTANGAGSSLQFADGGNVFLTLIAEIIPVREGAYIAQIRFTATGKKIDYRVLVNISKTDANHANIEIKSRDRTWQGIFDFKKGVYTTPPKLKLALSSEIRKKVEPFIPALNNQINYYRSKSEGMLYPIVGQPTPAGSTAEYGLGDFWDDVVDVVDDVVDWVTSGKGCRIVSWAVGGGGGAAAGAAFGGVWGAAIGGTLGSGGAAAFTEYVCPE